MSKAAKQSIFILIFLLVGSLGFAGYTIFEKQNLQKENLSVKQDLEDSQEREAEKIREIKKLKEQVKALEAEKDKLDKKVKTAEKQATDLVTQLGEVTEERDKWKRRIDSISKARDELSAKVKELENKIRNEGPVPLPAPPKQMVKKPDPVIPKSTVKKPAIPADNLQEGNDQYWAAILREKAALEVEIANLQEKLATKSVEIVELRQNNADLKLELDAIRSAKENMTAEITYKADLVNNLSLELARTKNDKKLSSERAEKLNKENMELRRQLKDLVSAKSSLEKSIVRLTQDKNKVEKELHHTESLIQNKIDEIWQIKDSLDQTFKGPDSSSEVELAPIVVTSNGEPGDVQGIPPAGLNGSIVSINEENNFVIIDIGQNKGVRLGDIISVYRDSKYIARLEIIQVRKDIAAADIKDQWSRIQVGDIIR